MKKWMYALIAIAVIGWIAFRFTAIGSENARYVFNAARVAADTGSVVELLMVQTKTALLREPIAVQNNRAYVASERVGKFRTGQTVGGGRIISVSDGIDFDSGMHVIRTQGVSDGSSFAESSYTGIFIPVYSVIGDSVYVVQDGKAVKRSIKIKNRDAENVLVSGGLQDGDVVILSNVSEGDKIHD